MDATNGDIKGRWESIGKFLRRGGPFVGPGFTADTDDAPTVRDILIVTSFQSKQKKKNLSLSLVSTIPS